MDRIECESIPNHGVVMGRLRLQENWKRDRQLEGFLKAVSIGAHSGLHKSLMWEGLGMTKSLPFVRGERVGRYLIFEDI
jgi:hypothetical protein